MRYRRKNSEIEVIPMEDIVAQPDRTKWPRWVLEAFNRDVFLVGNSGLLVDGTPRNITGFLVKEIESQRVYSMTEVQLNEMFYPVTPKAV